MKKRTLISLVFIILNVIMIIAQTYHSYNMELIKTFPIGLGISEFKVEMFRPSQQGPSALAFDSEGNLYISDLLNNKLIKFDNSLIYSNSYANGYAWGARRLFINEKGEFLIKNSTTFAVDDANGNKKFIISLRDSQYKNKISSYPNFIYLNNNFYTYLKDGSLISIPDPGNDNKKNMEKVLNYEETKNNILKIQNNDLYKSSSSIENINITDENYILLNGKIQSSNFKDIFNYNKIIQKEINKSYSPDNKKKKHLDGFTDELLSQFEGTFIGKDNDENTYWKGGNNSVFVFTPDVILIEAFLYERDKSRCLPTVHPSGNVYFMDYDDEKVYLYKVKRVW